MLLAFELSMPNVNSWNGRWSGEGKLYARVRSFRKDPEFKDYYHHNFGDGWSAGVKVRKVDAAEARKLRARSAGLCGYDWMIDSIVRDGKIAPGGLTP